MKNTTLLTALSLLVGHAPAQGTPEPLPLMTVVRELPHDARVVDVALTPDATHALTLTAKALHIWNLASGDKVRTVKAEGVRALRRVASSSDGRRVAISGADAVILLDARSWKEVRRLSADGLTLPGAVAFSPDGRSLLTGGGTDFSIEGRHALLWDLATGVVRHRLKAKSRLGTVAFNTDGTRLLAGSHDGIAVHDASTGELLDTLEGAADIALSAAGGRVAGTGHTLGVGVAGAWVWDMGRGELVGHIVAGERIAFTDLALVDGRRRLVTSGAEVRLWDAATGEELSWSLVDGIEPHKGSMGRVAVSRDGRWVLSAGEQRQARPSYVARVFALADRGGGGKIVPPSVSRGPTVRPVSPLLLAARAGDEARVRALLARGVKADVMDGSVDRPGRTALHYAPAAAIARMLLAHGADVNAADSSRATPLHEAMRRYSPRRVATRAVIELLVAKGADVNARRDGMHYGTPIQIAAARGHRPLVKWLRSKGARYDPVTAVLLDDVEHLTREVAAGRLDVASFRTAYGQKTLLHEARSRATVDVLLKSGAELETLDGWGSTPLVRALGNSRAEVARALIGHGANTAAKSADGVTAAQLLKLLPRRSKG